MEVYLDNSATTRCYAEVADIVKKTMLTDYGNPSAMHKKGVEAEQYVRDAAKQIGATLKVKPQEIYFTSGGTESNNWALVGAARANARRGSHIITSAIEHPSVSAVLDALAEEGFTITRLPVDDTGRVSVSDVRAAVTDQTILVSLMYVNNEVGATSDIAGIGAAIKEKNPETLFHVDAIQAYGKYKIHPGQTGIDLLSASGHKIHGPKGVGFLYIKDKVKIRPLILGGGQQSGMRSGTDNVPGIAGLGLAAGLSYTDFDEKIRRMRELKVRLASALSAMDGVVINGPALVAGAPHILNVSFTGVRSEVLLHTLEEEGVYVSAGSACSSHKRAPSPTLSALGCPQTQRESAIRFSFDEYNTPEEIDYAVACIEKVLPMLRRFTRR